MAGLFFITAPHVQPHAVFGGYISISGVWMLLWKEFLMAEDSRRVLMQPWCQCWCQCAVTQPKPRLSCASVDT